MDEMQDVLEAVNNLVGGLANLNNEDEDVFTLSMEQCQTWKAPEGWDRCWTEISRMMNKNRNAALGELETKEVTLDHDG